MNYETDSDYSNSEETTPQYLSLMISDNCYVVLNSLETGTTFTLERDPLTHQNNAVSIKYLCCTLSNGKYVIKILNEDRKQIISDIKVYLLVQNFVHNISVEKFKHIVINRDGDTPTCEALYGFLSGSQKLIEESVWKTLWNSTCVHESLPEIVLRRIYHDLPVLQFFPEEIVTEELCIKAVIKSARNLKFLPDDMKRRQAIYMSAVLPNISQFIPTFCIDALYFFPTDTNDKILDFCLPYEIWRILVFEFGAHALKYMNSKAIEMSVNVDLWCYVLSKSDEKSNRFGGTLIYYVPEHLKTYKMWSLAVHNNPMVIRFLKSSSLFNVGEFVKQHVSLLTHEVFEKQFADLGF